MDELPGPSSTIFLATSTDEPVICLEDIGKGPTSETSIVAGAVDNDDNLSADTFRCGSCQAQWHDLAGFLAHKTTCDEVVGQLETIEVPEVPDHVSDGEVRTLVLVEDSSIGISIQQDGGGGGGDEGVVEPSPRQTCSCRECGKSFKKSYDLQQHLRCHTGEKPYGCPLCDKRFTQKSNAKNHMVSHKVWPSRVKRATSFSTVQPEVLTDRGRKIEVVASNTFKCHFCDYTVSNHLQFRSHLATHADQKRFKCPRDDKLYQHLDEFLSHLAEHDDLSSVDNEKTKSFNAVQLSGDNSDSKEASATTCKRCRVTFKSRKHFETHMQMINHDVACQGCGKQFANERYLRRHFQRCSAAGAVERKTFTCAICDKQLLSEHYLKQHMLIHTGELPFKCDVCAAKFNRIDKLHRHQCTHADKRQFACPFRQHTGCSKEFHRYDKLKEHIRTHGNVKKLNCKACKKLLYSKEELFKHMNQMHPDNKNLLQCFQCDKVFKLEKMRRQHHKEVHGLTHTVQVVNSVVETNNPPVVSNSTDTNIIFYISDGQK